jgi:hypothetical protein
LSGSRFLKSVNRHKNKDRIAVNLWVAVASFWIDVRGQEVKAVGASGVQISDQIELVASMGNGVE